jgi:cell wall-associated NlpC family hydrolase
MKPSEVYTTARSLVGTPFQHQGRKKDVGIDCIGVPIWVANQLGLGDFDRFDYPRSPDGTMQPLVEEICSHEVLQPGVLLLFKISSTAQHCGITSLYENEPGLIHAWDIAGKVVEHRLTWDWIDKVVGCYGLPGVNYE